MNKKYLILSGLLLLCCTAFVLDTPNTYDENRLALIIGNGNYNEKYHSKLPNAPKDAKLMQSTLEKLGFEIIMVQDADLKTIRTKADEFEQRIQELKKDKKPLVTLFYYSGHGMHVDETTYLLPTDCASLNVTDLSTDAYPLNRITNRLEGHGNFLNIVMLDACRHNPFVDKMIVEKGGDPEKLQGYTSPKPITTNTPSGMYYSFATGLGKTALDSYDNSKNSPYIEGFIKALQEIERPFEEVFKSTHNHVATTTQSKQRALSQTSFFGTFYFKKPSSPPPPKDTDGDGFPDHLDPCPLQYAPNSKNGCPDAFDSDMVFIQGGTFSMGSNEYDWEQPIHSVTVSSFSMGKYEVTQKQWRDIMGNNPSHFSGCDNCPVEQVSWDDIQTFLQKLNAKTGKNYRLPTEAEWEYACRAGTATTFNTGDNLTTAQANYNGNYPWKNYPKGEYRQKTIPVGSFAPNAWGLYDMHGNVWEWCSDWYSSDYYKNSPSNNPKGAATGSYRVIRGGSWDFSADYCRSAYRGSNDAVIRNDSFGFRVCHSQF
jgi:formylglycine-generating enzyme required for sulfatase activity